MLLLKLLLLIVLPPIVALAAIIIGTALALQLALGPVFAEIAVCTQWAPRRA